MASFEVTKKITSVRLGEVKKEVPVEQVIVTDVSLPDDAPARVKTFRAEGRKWYVTVAYRPGSDLPFALFCHTNHKEKTAATADAVERLADLARKSGILEGHILALEEKLALDSNVTKLTRTVSLLLRHQVPIKNIIRVLDSVDGVFVGSFLFQIKKFLSNYVRDGERVEGGKCHDCGSANLVYAEGCMMCQDCGSSKCG